MFNQDNVFFGLGKKKTSSAKVILRQGVGKVLVNDRCFKVYFSSFFKILIINKMLQITSCISVFDIYINVKGGGIESQYNAVCFGLASAILNYTFNINKDIYDVVKKNIKKIGFISRDTRIVERKKFGLRKSRKKKQYSKR